MESIIITTQSTINQPVSLVWECWTKPEHIVNWNFASDDWHCPAAKNDFKIGGKFSYTMAAKDGSFSFDFPGTYDLIVEKRKIEYTLDDARRVWIEFSENGSETIIVQKFEIESENTPELQKTGWQAILNNFKKYCETI